MREETRLGSPVDFDPKEPERDDALGQRDAAAAIFDGDAEPWTTPDAWAPINRRGQPMREPVDTFRNLRVTVPRTLDEAFEALALSLELYETARETERDAHEAHAAHMDREPETRERAIGYLLDADEKSGKVDARKAALEITGERSASSRTAAEKLVDLVPFVVAFNAEARRLHRAKLDAEKETSVARRRHDTCKLFADRVAIVTVREASAAWSGDVIVDGGRMTRDEVRAMVADTASRRGGWTSYDGAANSPTIATGERIAADSLTDAPALANGETLTIDRGTVTP